LWIALAAAGALALVGVVRLATGPGAAPAAPPAPAVAPPAAPFAPPAPPEVRIDLEVVPPTALLRLGHRAYAATGANADPSPPRLASSPPCRRPEARLDCATTRRREHFRDPAGAEWSIPEAGRPRARPRSRAKA